MKIAITAVLTAAACFAVTAGTGLASHHQNGGKIIQLRVGDTVVIRSVQLPRGIWCVLGPDKPVSFECDNGGPQTKTGATVEWFGNRVEIQSRATPTAVPLKHEPGWRVWAFPAAGRY